MLKLDAVHINDLSLLGIITFRGETRHIEINGRAIFYILNIGRGMEMG